MIIISTRQLTTIHTRQLQQYTQDNYNNTHKTTTTIHTRQRTTIHTNNYNDIHKTTTTIYTRQLTTIHTRHTFTGYQKKCHNIYYMLPRIYMSRCKLFVQNLIRKFRVKGNGK